MRVVQVPWGHGRHQHDAGSDTRSVEEATDEARLLLLQKGSIEVLDGDRSQIVSEGEGLLIRPGEPLRYRYLDEVVETITVSLGTEFTEPPSWTEDAGPEFTPRSD